MRDAVTWDTAGLFDALAAGRSRELRLQARFAPAACTPTLSNGGHVELPNSKCSVIMTSVCVYLLPEGADYFEEMRGLSPDIWVPAKEAETLAAKLMENLK